MMHAIDITHKYFAMDLSALYQQAEHVSFLHSRYFVEGVITASCASPEIPLPDTWLPWTIAKHNQVQNNQQADYIFEQMFAFFKHVLAQMKDNSLSLPSYAVYENDSSSSALSKYCAGMMHAHQANEALWNQAWQCMQKKAPDKAPVLAKDLRHCLIVFSTFANPKTAIAQAKERGEGALAEKLPTIARSLQQSLNTYVRVSGELAAYLPNQFETYEQASS